MHCIVSDFPCIHLHDKFNVVGFQSSYTTAGHGRWTVFSIHIKSFQWRGCARALRDMNLLRGDSDADVFGIPGNCDLL